MRQQEMRLNVVDPIDVVCGDDGEMIVKLGMELIDAIAKGFDQSRIACIALGLVEAEQERTVVRRELAESAKPSKAKRIDLLRRCIANRIVVGLAEPQQRAF